MKEYENFISEILDKYFEIICDCKNEDFYEDDGYVIYIYLFIVHNILNDDLNQLALNYVIKLSSLGNLQHRIDKYNGIELGENLYYFKGTNIKMLR